eukprot:269183_1
MSLAQTIYWWYIKQALWWISTTILLIILIIEIRTAFYQFHYHSAIRMLSLSRSKSKSGSRSPSNAQESQTADNTDISETKQHNDNKTDNNTADGSKLLLLFTILTYLLYFILGIQSVVEDIYVDTNCQLAVVIGSIFYGGGKASMYLVFIYRIYFVYRDSAFCYNTTVLTAMSIFVVVEYIVASVLSYLNTNAEQIETENGVLYCVGHIPLIVIGLVVLFDLFISSLCLWLFIRPLLFLRICNDGNIGDLYALVMKYVILSVVTVFSTLLILIFIVVFDISAIVSVDLCINSICIMHFNKYYHESYKKLCCGAICVISKTVKK